MGSRGSVLPQFINQIKAGNPITITDPLMTRFMMTLEDAVDLVLYAFENGRPGEIFVRKSKASTLDVFVKALLLILNKPEHETIIIGTRHGEKLYESLLTREEMVLAQDLGEFFRVPPDLRNLNYGKYVDQGEIKISEGKDYNSHNTNRLDVSGMKTLLLSLKLTNLNLQNEVLFNNNLL